MEARSTNTTLMSSGAHVAFCAFLFDFHPIFYPYNPPIFRGRRLNPFLVQFTQNSFVLTIEQVTHKAPLPPTGILLANHTQLPWGLVMC